MDNTQSTPQQMMALESKHDNYPFDTEISQDNPHDDSGNHQFSPWFKKKTRKNSNCREQDRNNHGFLAKLNLTSKLPKMNKMPEGSHKEEESLVWVKNNLKNKINEEGIRTSFNQTNSGFSTRNQFIETRHNLYRKKMVKLYHKPKSIQLTLQTQNQKNGQNSNLIFSPVVSDRAKHRRQQSPNTKKQKRTISYHQGQNKVQPQTDIFKTRQKFYKTLELKLSNEKQISVSNRRQHVFTPLNLTKNEALKIDRPGINQKMNETMKMIQTKNEMACQGKKIEKNEHQSYRQKMKARLLFDNRAYHDKIFLQ